MTYPRPSMGRLALLLTPLCVTDLQAALIAYDDFSTNAGLLSFVASPELSANAGFFPTDDRFDLFGVTDRAAGVQRGSSHLVDGTLDGAAGGSPGLLRSTRTDPLFVVDDPTNRDHPTGPAEATWSFDTRGAQGLELAIDLAARGDFERGDRYRFSYGFNHGPWLPLFDIAVDETLRQGYRFEDGSLGELADPLLLGGTLRLGNLFTTHTGALTGSGDLLRLRFTAEANGDGEVFAFDNIRISDATHAVPLPAPAWLLGAGLFGVLAAVRRSGCRQRHRETN